MPETTLLHGTCIAIGEAGVIILGPPGAGKSDLALRLIDEAGCGLTGRPRAAQLVADDQVVIRLENGVLKASPPPTLAGKFEIRGLGIVTVPARATVRLTLAVRIVASAIVERLPEPEKSRFEVLGISLPLVLIDAAKASAPARVRAALDWLGMG